MLGRNRRSRLTLRGQPSCTPTDAALREFVDTMSTSSQAELNKIARQLNERPRKTLDYECQLSDSMTVLLRPVERVASSFLLSCLPYLSD